MRRRRLGRDCTVGIGEEREEDERTSKIGNARNSKLQRKGVKVKLKATLFAIRNEGIESLDRAKERVRIFDGDRINLRFLWSQSARHSQLEIKK